MKRNQMLTLCSSVLSFLVASAILRPLAQAQSAAVSETPKNIQPKTAAQQYKNIEVLKTIPADQLIPAMQFITSSLGVGCEFCHVEGAFEKDDKKTKRTARNMMEMMITINSENFDGHREVTCFSCHRGHAMPVGIPPVMADEPNGSAGGGNPHAGENPIEVTNPNAADAPTPDQLIDKYLTASGGSDAITKITSRVMKGTITFGDSKIPIDIFSKDPDKRASFAHTPDGDSITAFDGHEGWLGVPKRPVHDMHGSDIDGASIDADLHFATHLRAMFTSLELQGVKRVGDQDAYLVTGERSGKTPLNLYFDKQSGLLLRLVRFGDTPLGELPTQIDYADYREADGVRIPFRWTLARPSGRFTIQVTEMKQNVPVDNSKFAKPLAAGDSPKDAAK